MKRKLGPILLFALLIALTPALALLAPATTDDGTPGDETENPGVSDGNEQQTVYEGETLLLLDESSGDILAVTEREYVLGALMCEMPALYEIEALKAQAVACHTYALCVKAIQEENPDPALNGAAFKVNTQALSGYITQQQAAQIYGSNFEEYYGKMEEAVDATLRYVLTYDGEPISACYHAISPGRTENSENIFVTALPYLVSVDSSQDITATDYLTEVRLSPGDFSTNMRFFDAAFTADGEPDTWVGAVRTTEAGTVLGITLCGREYTGPQVREAMSLRSAAFELTYENSEFVFKVRGYGHGVGMSQNGANGMAKEGKTFDAILSHYYPGAVLSQVA